LIGELDGAASARVKSLIHAFRRAGFPTARTTNIDAWQKTHVTWVCPLANAIYLAKGDNHALSSNRALLRLVVQAVREGFLVLRNIGIPITPSKLRAWECMPEPLVVALLSAWANTDHFKTVAVEHTMAATDEMRQLTDAFVALSRLTTVEIPAIEKLRSFIPDNH
jgi:ketopantoate reductase